MFENLEVYVPNEVFVDGVGYSRDPDLRFADLYKALAHGWEQFAVTDAGNGRIYHLKRQARVIFSETGVKEVRGNSQNSTRASRARNRSSKG